MCKSQQRGYTHWVAGWLWGFPDTATIGDWEGVGDAVAVEVREEVLVEVRVAPALMDAVVVGGVNPAERTEVGEGWWGSGGGGGGGKRMGHITR